MAKGKKTGGRDFKPGVSGNPAGGPKIPEEVKVLRKLTIPRLEEIADLILDGNRVQLTQIVGSSTEPAIRVAYAKAALNAMNKGDLTGIETILNRLVGKPKDKVEVTGKDGAPLGNLSDEQLEARLARFVNPENH